MKQLIIALIAAIPFSVLANPPGSGTTNGNGCTENCGNGGGQGGNGGQGGSSSSSSHSTNTNINGSSSQAGAIAGSSSIAGALSGSVGIGEATGGNAQGGSANVGPINAGGNSTNQFSSRAYALSAGSIGSPSNDTCAAHVSVFFGAATFPVTLESCVALNEALFLVKLGENRAAIERLCQLASIGATSLCNKAPEKM